MYIIIFHIVFVIATFLLYVDHDQDLKKINLAKSVGYYENINLSKIGYKIQYIPLERSSEGHFLEKIVHIDLNNELIVISDYDNCFLFKQNGSFQKKIGNRGRGSGEYDLISGICLSENNEYIYLSSSLNLYKYSLDGDLKKHAKMHSVKTDDGYSIPIRPWFPIGDELFLGNVPNYSGTQKNMLIVFDENGQLIKEFKNYDLYSSGLNMANTWDTNTSFYHFAGLYTFKKLKNDTLYRMTKELNFYPEYIFSLGKYRFPHKTHYRTVQEFMKDVVNYVTLNSILETKNYFFLTCDFGKHTKGYEITWTSYNGEENTFKISLVKGIYNKSTDNMTFLEPNQYDGFTNDLDGGFSFFPQKVLNDSILVSWVDAYQLKAHVASEAFRNSKPKYPEKKKKLEELANSLDENDNPVLMLVNLKE